MDYSFILERLILAGGPPRSGTTLLAMLLNSHPHIATAIDNSVYESWALYYYRSRQGLVQQLRTRNMPPDEIRSFLLQNLIKDNYVYGIAPSQKTAPYPAVPPPIRPDSEDANRERIELKPSSSRQLKLALKQLRGGESLLERKEALLTARDLPRQIVVAFKRFVHKLALTSQPTGTHQGLTRYRLPVALFRAELHLCLKSPEIVFVLPQLTTALPKAKFVLVYRPVIEIAESMYRKGFEWQLPSYHRRWRQELGENGNMVAPPGVPPAWQELWKVVSDFQRCVIYATSYLRAMVLGLLTIQPSRVFVYSHAKLRSKPWVVLEPLAQFLDVDYRGFQDAVRIVRNDAPVIPYDLVTQYEEIESQIGIRNWVAQVANSDTVSPQEG